MIGKIGNKLDLCSGISNTFDHELDYPI